MRKHKVPRTIFEWLSPSPKCGGMVTLPGDNSSVVNGTAGFERVTMSSPHRLDRRRKPRIDGPISATARGIDSSGREFELETILDNLSAGGLHLRLSRRVEKASELSLVFRLPPGACVDDPELRLTASGIVRRVEPRSDRTCGVGVEISRHHQIEMTYERLNAFLRAQAMPVPFDLGA
jgi:hypothetical protein